MDDDRFDALARTLGGPRSRRRVLGWAGGAALAAAGALPAAAGKARCKPARCPVFEKCGKHGCSCHGGPSQAPSSCCGGPPGFISSCATPAVVGFVDPTTCSTVESCPAGSKPCVGTACKVCCPKGTTCKPQGWCQGQATG